MLREILRTAGSAFRLFISGYRSWFLFSAMFFIFFKLLGTIIGSLIILVPGYIFYPQYFSPGDITDTGHIWWAAQCLTVNSHAVSLSIALFAVYMRARPISPSFRDFLRSTPKRIWNLYILLVLALSLTVHFVIYGAIAANTGGSKNWITVLKTLEWIKPAISFTLAALIFMRITGMTGVRKHWRNIFTYVIIDYTISFALTMAVSFVSSIIPDFTEENATWTFWVYNLMGFFFVDTFVLLTISFYSSLLSSSFPQQQEEIIFEMETPGETILKQ